MQHIYCIEIYKTCKASIGMVRICSKIKLKPLQSQNHLLYFGASLALACSCLCAKSGLKLRKKNGIPNGNALMRACPLGKPIGAAVPSMCTHASAMSLGGPASAQESCTHGRKLGDQIHAFYFFHSQNVFLFNLGPRPQRWKRDSCARETSGLTMRCAIASMRLWDLRSAVWRRTMVLQKRVL